MWSQGENVIWEKDVNRIAEAQQKIVDVYLATGRKRRN
jgi:hypothetical protein